MNRREFIKTGLVTSAALVATKGISAANPVYAASANNRLQRYKEYSELLKKNQWITENYLVNLNIYKIVEAATQDAISSKKYSYFKCGYTKLWQKAYNLATNGDCFNEIVYDNDSPILIQELPAHTMYRIETLSGKLIEFQQSHDGPDYESIARFPVEEAHNDTSRTVVRFAPKLIHHMRIGRGTRSFGPYYYPYGVSLLEPLRKDKNATISQYAIDDFHDTFVKGVDELRRIFS